MALRIGVVGVGFGTTVHVPAFQSEGIEVAAICARRPERAEEAAARFSIERACTDWEELVAAEDLDALSIVTPTAMHHPIALAALRAGKHVILEKPFAMNTAEAKELAAEAAASGRTAMIAHEFRFASARMRAKELIEQGYLGELRLGLLKLLRDPGARGEPAPFRPDRDVAAARSGFLFSLGSHYIDCLRHFFGEVEAVSGELMTLSPERSEGGGVVLSDADDSFMFRLYFASGGVAEMVASRQTPGVSTSSIELFGSEGTLVTPQEGMNPPPHGTLLGARRGEGPLQQLDIPERLEPFADERDERLMPFRLFTRKFLRGIAEGSSPAPNFDDGYACQQILDALYESSARGSRVAIAPR